MQAPQCPETGGLPANEQAIQNLLRHLLDHMAVHTPMACHLNQNQADETTVQPVQGSTIVQFEYAGLWYKLVKTTPPCRPSALSRREQEIVQLVASGHADKSIAQQLGISPHTVNTHIRRIFGKLGVNNRAEMVACALSSQHLDREFIALGHRSVA